jgi:hypothetical protein
MKARSDKTEIRGLRSTLRNARSALRYLLDRAPINELDKGLARTVIDHIDDRLAPKVRRGARGARKGERR